MVSQTLSTEVITMTWLCIKEGGQGNEFCTLPALGSYDFGKEVAGRRVLSTSSTCLGS